MPAPAAPGLLPFTAIPIGAQDTHGLSKHHNPHSAKPARGFVQSGFNEVRRHPRSGIGVAHANLTEPSRFR
jgi:hypothetical protein